MESLWSYYLTLICLTLVGIVASFGDFDYLEEFEEYDLEEKFANVKPLAATVGLLYPRESMTREVRSLDGVWMLVKGNASDPLQGIKEKWYAQALRKTGHEMVHMPVPASYNDITVSKELRDHVGTVWYERDFFVPHRWSKEHQRTWLRFGSVHYLAMVWINGQPAVKHCIGHLPFEAEVGHLLKFGNKNRITVMVDNRLDNSTIPQGEVLEEESDTGVVHLQSYTFDFFNYAGIHRSVQLYTTPQTYIRDIELNTQLINKQVGRIDYRLDADLVEPHMANLVLLKLHNHLGKVVVHQINRNMRNGTLVVPNVKPWWPYLMHPEPGYMYTLEVQLIAASGNETDGEILDVYSLPVGIRSLSWDNNSLYINGMPAYLRGFGKHEDSDLRGKGLDNALLVRDFNLLKWVGANAYRTSHYPYSEESMQFADEHGIMIVDECPSVDTDHFEPLLLEQHMTALEQLIHRDRNHASVIAWSIANEPRSWNKYGAPYFRSLANYTKSIAHGRPLTGASNAFYPSKCMMSQFLDIIGINRYNAWYHSAGRTDMIVNKVFEEVDSWRQEYKKPVILFEYGGDALAGFHMLPSSVWSEDYQVELLSKHFQAFDKLRKLNWFIGEFVWNFADFQTEQSTTRAGGNKKGMFTRNRQPKSTAYLLRQRYYALAFKLNNASMPTDLFDYIINWN